jgi:hypothetical protein
MARCPIHAAIMPCDGEHESRRARTILAQHESGDHTYCATLARCDERPLWVQRAQAATLPSKDMTRA